MPALAQRCSKSPSLASKPPSLISHGTAPAAGGLGWHGHPCWHHHPCWHPTQLSLDTRKSPQHCESCKPCRVCHEKACPESLRNSSGVMASGVSPTHCPAPQGWRGCKINNSLVKPLSMIQAWVSLCHIEGSFIPNGLLTSYLAHCSGLSHLPPNSGSTRVNRTPCTNPL